MRLHAQDSSSSRKLRMTSSSVCLPAVASPKMDWLRGSMASCVCVGGLTTSLRDGRSDGLSFWGLDLSGMRSEEAASGGLETRCSDAALTPALSGMRPDEAPIGLADNSSERPRPGLIGIRAEELAAGLI